MMIAEPHGHSRADAIYRSGIIEPYYVHQQSPVNSAQNALLPFIWSVRGNGVPVARAYPNGMSGFGNIPSMTYPGGPAWPYNHPTSFVGQALARGGQGSYGMVITIGPQGIPIRIR